MYLKLNFNPYEITNDRQLLYKLKENKVFNILTIGKVLSLFILIFALSADGSEGSSFWDVGLSTASALDGQRWVARYFFSLCF